MLFNVIRRGVLRSPDPSEGGGGAGGNVTPAELWIARHCFSKQMRYRAVKLKKGEKL